MNHIHDLIIIGSGPAGLTAAIYASRAELDTIIIEKHMMSGGQIINTYEVDNYPGIPEINGFDLALKFREHCDKLGAKFVEGDVVDLTVEDQIKKVTLSSGDEYLAKTVIISTGAVARKLGIKGEDEMSGMGVSYCATCDGAFFKNRTTVVVGGGDVAVEDAIYLARLCKKVYIVHRRDEFRAVKTLVTQLNKHDNIEIIWDSVVEEILGEEFVESVKIKNVKTQENSIIATDGVFIAIGYNPASEVYKKVVEVDPSGYIVADESCETSVPGIFVAGDIRTKALKQIITAASDGANAVTSVERYLNSL